MAEVKIIGEQDKYPSNSIMSRDKPTEKEPVQPVVKGKTIQQKESIGQRIKKMIMPGNIHDARSYVINQIIIPGIKNGALSMLEMMFFGQVTNRFGQRTGWVQPRDSRTSYAYQSQSNLRMQNSQIISRTQRETFSFNNITFVEYDDAKDVIESLLDILDRNGVVCVGDFYSLCGYKTEATDYDWGWTAFQKLEPRRLREGYAIDMQPPIYLNKR